MDPIIEEVIKKYWNKIKKKANVIGYSGKLQPKIIAGIEYPETKCFRIYVTKKEKVKNLSIEDIIPPVLRLNALEALLTDVVEIGTPKALSNKERRRPVCGGISTMHKDGTACTISGFFKDNVTGKILVASNNHCYALEDKANFGDSILQPAPYDGGKDPKDRIGWLSKKVSIFFDEYKCPFRNFFHRIKKIFSSSSNKVDIAFAMLEVPYENIATYIGEYKGKCKLEEKERVTKSGRTTEQTYGKVLDTNWNGMVNYSRGIVFFQDCYLIEGEEGPFVQGGDSGSPLFNMKNELAGVIFAGTDTTGIACKIENIEEEANVTLITKGEV